MQAAAIRLVGVLAVATVALVAGASARNKARGVTADPLVTGSVQAVQQRKVAPISSEVVQRLQHGPDRRAELVGQGFTRAKKARD